jgi:hypothetical protein
LLLNPVFACKMTGLGLSSSVAISASLRKCFLNQFIVVANLPDQAFGTSNPLKEFLLNIECQHPPIERISAKLEHLSKKSKKPFFVACKHRSAAPAAKERCGYMNDNVLYHSLSELACVGSIWSEMATQPRESHNVLEADFWPASL